MNKKVLTLCAGFLLAGGMLSSLSAEKLSAVADNGKYYKIARLAYASQANDWTESLRYVTISNGKSAVTDSDLTLDAYWTVSKNSTNGYTLTNLNGTVLSVGSTTSFIEHATEALPSIDSEFQLKLNSTEYVAVASDWTLAVRKQGEYSPAASVFDAVATNLQVVAGLDATDFFAADGDTYVADGKTYRMYYTHPTMGNMMVTNILKANYDKSLKSWSFTYNEDGSEKKFGNEVDFELIKVGDDLVMALPSGKGYVQCNGLEDFTIVSSIEEATVFAFEATEKYDPVTVGVLNYYEKDGFSVEITCDKNEKGDWDFDALTGDVFKGHLVPMTWNGNKFVVADKYATSYYLKNSEGKYIVAVPYEVETALQKESLYTFTTISESELIHNLKRAAINLEEQKYFGFFSAFVDEADKAQDAEALEEITMLQVQVVEEIEDETNYYQATVGRADFKSVPTLVAACEHTDPKTTLKPIHIKLGSGQVVDWKELLQPKFFTVEKYNAAGTTSEGMLTTSSVSNTEFRTTKAGNDLETQFALTIDGDYYKFTNRETPSSYWMMIPVSALYYTDKDFTYKWGNNVYVIKPVAEVNEADGYKRFEDSDLNLQYRIAYSSDVFGSVAYLAENHDDAKDAEYHTIGLKKDKEDALVFNMKKYNAARNLKDEQANHTYNYHPTDSIYVISKLGFYNTKTKEQDFKNDTLKVLSYTFVNQFNEPLIWSETDASTAEGLAYVSDVYKTGKEKYANAEEAHNAALKFAVRYDNNSKTKYNLRPIYNGWKFEFNETEYGKTKSDADLYQTFSSNFWKMYAGDATDGILDDINLYDRTENDLFDIEVTTLDVYRRLAQNVDTVSIFRDANTSEMLYENTTEIAEKVFVNFLGLGNIAQMKDMAPAMVADTAYVRYNTYKPQYMLIVDPTIHPAGTECPICGKEDCEHAIPTNAWTEGRILVNLVDSANAWDAAHKHQVGNPYKKEGYNKLGFINAIHRSDSLIVDGKRQFIGNNDDHIAKFQFRYVDTESKSFVIETKGGYLKNLGGDLVVVSDINSADVFNMTEGFEGDPTANETIAAGNVVVAGVNGAVVVKGAEGKNVIVSTILGKVVANEVVSSDNATIAAPAGVVVVSVDGESFKVVVK